MNTGRQGSWRIGSSGELPRSDNARGACCQKQNKAECISRTGQLIYCVQSSSLLQQRRVCDYAVATRMVASCAWQYFAPHEPFNMFQLTYSPASCTSHQPLVVAKGPNLPDRNPGGGQESHQLISHGSSKYPFRASSQGCFLGRSFSTSP
jgi:hypothetical protein